MPATLEQSAHRYRNDDGSEAAATWVFAKDTDGSLDVDTQYRMRFALKETTNFFFEKSATYALYYDKNSSGGFSPVTTSSSNIQIKPSIHYAHATDCTQQISAPDLYKATTNLMSEQNTVTLNGRFRGRTTETEWCFELIGADLNDLDTIALRIYRNAAPIEVYTQVPIITVNKPAAPPQGLQAVRGRDLLAALQLEKREKVVVEDPEAERRLTHD